NYHAHLLLTTREVFAAGLGAKAGLDMSGAERVRLGLPNIREEFTAIRERWATITNEALKEANIEARVDHRSLAEQGIDREARPHIPFAAFKIERAGQYSEVAASIRADHNARVQARLERAAARESTLTQSSAPDPTITQPSGHQPPRSLEDIRREARENWLRMRAEQSEKTQGVASESRSADHTAQPRSTAAADDDYQP
ncbi:MAG: MobA/MobL family protein, partial [Sinobacteraceae bacterium]|nr:MobA/MobL family protein [Nevskiaceae bacterium]